VKVGTNLTQDGVEGLEAAGFTIDDGEDVFDKFAEAFYARQGNVVQPSHPPKGSGDYHPTTRENKAFLIHLLSILPRWLSVWILTVLSSSS
jgi:hypothetical protein